VVWFFGNAREWLADNGRNDGFFEEAREWRLADDLFENPMGEFDK
jgi:hypothetical protein